MKHTQTIVLGHDDEGNVISISVWVKGIEIYKSYDVDQSHEIEIDGINPELRDNFAAKAMQGLLYCRIEDGKTDNPIQPMCEAAYLIADNMITARENG